MDDIKLAQLGDKDGPNTTNEYEARLAWNTRAPILSESEMEMLEGLE